MIIGCSSVFLFVYISYYGLRECVTMTATTPTTQQLRFTDRRMTVVRVKRELYRLVGFQFTIESRRHRIPNCPVPNRVSFLVVCIQEKQKKKNNFIHKPLLCQCVSIKTQYLVLIRIIRYILSFAFSAKVFKFL